MPEIRSQQIPSQRSIKTALRTALIEQLPTDLSSHELARWLVEFKSQLNDFLSADAPDDLITLREISYRSAFLNLLKERVSFYFSALFHISSASRAIPKAIAQIEMARKPENLEQSIRNIHAVQLDRISNKEPEPLIQSDKVQAILLSGLEAASSRYQRILKQSSLWTLLWRGEVESLRRSISALEIFSDQVVPEWREIAFRLWISSSKSDLQRSMSEAGISFDEYTDLEPVLDSKSPLLNYFVARNQLDDELHFFNQWIELHSSNEKYCPLYFLEKESDMVLDILQKKYIQSNPFEPYKVGSAAATLQLRDLVREHRLPNGFPSPWLYLWKQQLDTLHPLIDVVTPSINFDQQLSLWCLRTADSCIKNSIDEVTGSQLPWNMFLQTLFEQKWLFPIYILLSGRISKSNSSIESALLERLSTITVESLNSIGYELKAPDIQVFLRSTSEKRDYWQ